MNKQINRRFEIKKDDISAGKYYMENIIRAEMRLREFPIEEVDKFVFDCSRLSNGVDVIQAAKRYVEIEYV